ncbi:MAG: ribokinase [Pseudomonadota bacterium]
MNGGILVIGSVNLDYVMRTPHLPAAGETVLGSDFMTTLGGKGANQAVACARLGGTTRFVACVGDDTPGQDARAAFEKDGLPLDCIHVIDTAHTGSAMILVDDNGENCIGISAGANAALNVERVTDNREYISAAEYLLLQLETPMTAVTRAAIIARQHLTQVVLNPAPVSEALPSELLLHVDVITPNQTEAAALTGLPIDSRDDLVTAAQALHAMGPSVVIITLGADGAMVSDDGIVNWLPAPAVNVVDTVAAGDTFNGALVVALAEGRAMIDAVAFAIHAAAVSVTRRGAQDAVPTRADVDLAFAD